jgi:hypothetical protein
MNLAPEEPQRDTACNKTWIGYTDPSLTAMNKGIPNATLPYDIGNSLPMGGFKFLFLNLYSRSTCTNEEIK